MVSYPKIVIFITTATIAALIINEDKGWVFSEHLHNEILHHAIAGTTNTNPVSTVRILIFVKVVAVNMIAHEIKTNGYVKSSRG